MSVSKSLRFAILRRDGFRCRYCGASADETAEGLVVDHMIPVAHGGDDDPTNLVTACTDCNAGKAASSADVPGPDDARINALRSQLDGLMERYEIEAQIHALHQSRYNLWRWEVEALRERWIGEFYDHVAPPTDEYLIRHLGAGIPVHELLEAITTTANRVGRGPDAARYFYGICRNKLAAAEAPA